MFLLYFDLALVSIITLTVKAIQFIVDYTKDLKFNSVLCVQSAFDNASGIWKNYFNSDFSIFVYL